MVGHGRADGSPRCAASASRSASASSPSRSSCSSFVWGVPARPGRVDGRQPRPVGEHGQRLAERQPERQQLEYPEGGIVPFRLAIEGLRRAPTRSTSTTTSRPAATRPTTSSRRGTSRTPRARSAPRAGGGDLLEVPVARVGVDLRVPERRLQGERPVRPRRRGLLGRAAAADDLGRHDHVDQRPGPLRARRTATARPTSS